MRQIGQCKEPEIDSLRVTEREWDAESPLHVKREFNWCLSVWAQGSLSGKPGRTVQVAMAVLLALQMLLLPASVAMPAFRCHSLCHSLYHNLCACWCSAQPPPHFFFTSSSQSHAGITLADICSSQIVCTSARYARLCLRCSAVCATFAPSQSQLPSLASHIAHISTIDAVAYQ